MQSDPDETDKQRDEALAETFPASDPPAIGGATGPNDQGPARKPQPIGPAPVVPGGQ